MLFFFQKKKQKALFCFAEEHAEPQTLKAYIKLLLFPEKEAKSVVLLRRRAHRTPTLSI
jgi:hypothetical protein